ncbi:GNAT family N-acetyltransferase [Archangium lansingense]|uniref:GNAT family N-acetyltransferase n=1 Tax=Archangium lansingense TaxID=2995310 RepID=A0ABT4A9X7_9BACT|nr:GNAT family N-acetyltransferase [Archangium lansinium]MCY1078451.1 GNAT family N-acetyltransferase [Archangium lansinium]
MVKIKVILPNSPHLPTVKKLWRKHSATLGFLPEGAFDEQAERRCILGAFDEFGECIGYVLYRRKDDRIAITHLCVDSSKRGCGTARKLVEELSRIESVYRGMELWCRRDFPVSNVWPKLGFVASNERVGRSHDGDLLTFWWRENPHPSLFAVPSGQGQVRAVIDANIFFDLVAGKGTRRADSKALLADWLRDSLRLYVTDELFNEILRNKDGLQERKRLRKEVSRFEKCLPCPWDTISRIYEELSVRLPSQGTSDESDLRHLARAIAGGFSFFVTRDGRLLDADEDIYRAHNITVIRPSDLVLHIDALSQESRYQPKRLSGTMLHIGHVQTGQDELLAPHLHNANAGESKLSFLSRLREFLATPHTTECEWVAGPEGNALAILVRRRTESGELLIPLLRVAPSQLAPTLARHLLFYCVKKAVQQDCHSLRITDSLLDSDTQQAIRMDPFLKTQDGWIRPCIARLEPASELLGQFRSFLSERLCAAEIAQASIAGIASDDLRQNPHLAAEFERAIWPSKVSDAVLPTYVVPIQPQWAQHLFDERLAAHDLFGARIDLALNREAAYYRAAHAPYLKAPARILWYVSQDKKGRFGGTGEVRACSRLEEVVIDTPKLVFRRFRRLGIYEWRHVLDTARGDVNGRLMALRFCDSEALRRPVPRKQMLSVLEEFGIRTQLQSPIKIPPEAFVRLYDASRS